MKKLCVFYANCQADGIVHFLRKTRMADEYASSVQHNWQILMGEQSFDRMIDDLHRCDLVVFQPCNGYQRTNGEMVPGTDELFATYCKHFESHQKISFAYQFNHGFFPLLNVSPGPDGWITAGLLKQKAWGPQSVDRGSLRGYNSHMMIRDYNGGMLRFDCARRFAECLAEQARREESTDIKMVPWILQNYRKQRLFLTQNHLTSCVFEKLAAEVLESVYGARDFEDLYYHPIQTPDENEVGMNGVMPVHQAVVDEMGLEYPATEGAHEYYRDLLEKMIGNPKQEIEK